MKDDAASRVRQRLTEWVHREGHGSRQRIARAVSGRDGDHRSGAWVTDLLDGPENGDQDLRLRDLDAIADVLKVSAAELVSSFDHAYAELSESEARLLQHYRNLPETVRDHMMGYLDYLHAAYEREIERDLATATDEATPKRDRGNDLDALGRVIEKAADRVIAKLDDLQKAVDKRP